MPGIGSDAIARKIADRFPYFADRANFPYGGEG